MGIARPDGIYGGVLMQLDRSATRGWRMVHQHLAGIKRHPSALIIGRHRNKGNLLFRTDSKFLESWPFRVRAGDCWLRDGIGMTSTFHGERGPGQLGLMTPAEVAAIFHVDAKTVARWAEEGRLASIRTLGGHRRYLASEVLSLVNGTSEGQGS